MLQAGARGVRKLCWGTFVGENLLPKQEMSGNILKKEQKSIYTRNLFQKTWTLKMVIRLSVGIKSKTLPILGEVANFLLSDVKK